MQFNCSDIVPYSGKDFEDAIMRLKNYPQFLNDFTDIVSKRSFVLNALKKSHTRSLLTEGLDKVSCCDDFQKIIICDVFLKQIEKESIEKFTYSGISRNAKPCLYISNHRDIVLDTALLDLALYRSNEILCDMVIGDNLLVNQFTTDMFKVTGGITVRRNLSSASDLRTETIRLSSCIIDTVVNRKRSVWIAQKSGRSKDGLDNTNPAILKMLYLSAREEGLSFSRLLEKIDIVPVAISYQYDPCDVTKSHQEIRKLKAQGCYDVYHKKKYEDLIDMVRGLREYKGNVHISVGQPLSPSIVDVKTAAREIDRQIHTAYRLWNTNYFAYDTLMGTSRFKSQYEDFDGNKFLKKYRGYSEDVLKYVLNQYANPVRSMLNENTK